MTEAEIRIHSIAFGIADIAATGCALMSGNWWTVFVTLIVSVGLGRQFNHVKAALLKGA